MTRWRDSPCSWTERINIVNVSVLPNLIYRFNTIAIRIPASYCWAMDKLILKFIWRQKVQNSQLNIEGEQSWRTDTT